MSGDPFRSSGAADAGVAAAQWALRHSDADTSGADETRFAEWLDQDADNAVAYADARWALDAVARHAGEPELLALRHAALAARGNRRSRWKALGGGAMAAAGLAALLLWTSLPAAGPKPAAAVEQVAQRKAAPTGVFRTGIGEKAAVELPDGSVVTLDTDSEIRVAYSPKVRAIYLVSGQALFEVAHGRPQPFQVFAKGQRITAVGTVFNVRIEGPSVRVSMVDGVVRMRPDNIPGFAGAPPSTELTLTAGEAAFAEPNRPAAIERGAEIPTAVSWKGGVLVFNDTPLLDAVAEINRYTKRPIAIADAGVAAYRVNGVFRTNDTEHFSAAMAEVFPIEITRAPDGSPTLRARKD
jgi:transmembrane sensor